MAFGLTVEEREAIVEKFKKLDLDGDGKIMISEIRAFYYGKNLNRSEDEIEFIFKMLDIDGNGFIEFSEFLEMIALFEYNKEKSEDHLRQMFRALDKDRSGILSTDEIKIMWDIFSDLDFDMPSVEEIEPTIKLLDLNGSGKIDYEEFMKRFNFELFPGLECLGFD